MAKAEFKEIGRRCHACNGPGWMQRYSIFSSAGSATVDFHDVCVGSWLMRNILWWVSFMPGEVTGPVTFQDTFIKAS